MRPTGYLPSPSPKRNWQILANFLAKTCFWAEVSPLILLNFQLIEFLVGMCFTYLTFLISLTQSCICCLAYAIGPTNAICFAYQISEQASIIFDETMRQDRLPINMSVASEPMLLPAYIEDCRMKVMEPCFQHLFQRTQFFQKGDDFVRFNGSDLVVCRVQIKYDSNLEVFFINFINCLSSCYVIC